MKDNEKKLVFSLNSDTFVSMFHRQTRYIFKVVSIFHAWGIGLIFTLVMAYNIVGKIWAKSPKMSLKIEEIKAQAQAKKTATAKMQVPQQNDINEVSTAAIVVTSKAADDTRPVAHEELSKITTQEFINKYGIIAQQECDAYGILPSITMAQAIIESRSGNSWLAKNAKNYFGVKCFSKTCKAGHCTNKTDDTHKDFFVVYNSVESSFRHHTEFLLRNGIYKGIDKTKDYKVAARILKPYATDPDYVTKIINVIEHYKLYKLDNI